MHPSLDDRKVDESQIERAARFFLEQKYKLHHHPVHVSHSRYEVPTYLQTLAINVLERHNNMPKDYLHTLSTAKLSTWDAYQHQLDKVNPASEVDGECVQLRLCRGSSLIPSPVC